MGNATKTQIAYIDEQKTLEILPWVGDQLSSIPRKIPRMSVLFLWILHFHSIPGGVLSLIPSTVMVWKGARVKVPVSMA